MSDKKEALLVGATGRMGKEIRLASERPLWKDRVEIAYGLVGAGSSSLGARVSHVKHPLISEWSAELPKPHVIIDFSSDAGTRKALSLATVLKVPILVASTGLSVATVELVTETSKHVPVLFTANTSLVVTAMKSLVREAAKLLGPGFDAELIEIHHRMKKDAPSGTALMLLREIADARGARLEDVLDCGRHGTEALRRTESIGAQAVRGGDVAGEHTVYFFGEGERLEITQRATSRAVFAEGALRGALWLADKSVKETAQARQTPNGLYSMEDVLRG